MVALLVVSGYCRAQTGNYSNPYDSYTYYISPNAWGDPTNKYGSDSISVPDVGGDFWSATWSWPTGDPNSWVTAYPDAVLNVNSGGSGIALWNLDEASSYWSYGFFLNSSDTNGYDVAYDTYIAGTTYEHVGNNLVQGTYSNTEVMIWMEYANTGPIGSEIATYTDPSGRLWDVYFGVNSSAGLEVYSFLPASGSVNEATLQLQNFYNWLMYSLPYQSGYVASPSPLPTADGRFNNLSTGVEIHEGAGTLTTWALANSITTFDNPDW